MPMIALGPSGGLQSTVQPGVNWQQVAGQWHGYAQQLQTELSQAQTALAAEHTAHQHDNTQAIATIQQLQAALQQAQSALSAEQAAHQRDNAQATSAIQQYQAALQSRAAAAATPAPIGVRPAPTPFDRGWAGRNSMPYGFALGYYNTFGYMPASTDALLTWVNTLPGTEQDQLRAITG